MVVKEQATNQPGGTPIWRTALTSQMMMLFGGRGVAFLFTFAIPLVLVRLFSQTEFGVYKQIFLIYGTLLSIISLGIPASLYYFLPREAKDRGLYISQTLVFLSGVGAIGVGIMIVFGENVALLLNSPALKEYAPYIGVMTAVMLLGVILETIMIATKQITLATITLVVTELLKACVIIGAAAITGSLYILLGGMIGLGLLRLAALAFYLRKEGLLVVGPLRGQYLQSQLTFAMPFGLAAILEMLASAVPQFFVSHFYDPATFAIFSVGCFTLPLVPLLFDSVADTALVKITELEKARDMKELVQVVSDSIRKLSLVCFPLLVFLLTVAHEFIVGLFTSKFEASVPIFMVFIFTLPLWALSVDYVPRAFAETGFLLKMYGLRLVLTVIFFLLFIKAWGLSGAALAVVLGLAITRGYTILKVARLAGTTMDNIVPWQSIGKILVYSMIAAFLVFVMKHFIQLPALFVLVGASIVFAGAYLSLIWNSGLVHDEEKDILAAYLHRMRGAVLGYEI